MEWQKLGKYERKKLLGNGTTGTVYLAHDTILHKEVAIKVIDADPDQHEQVLEEARLLDRLNASGRNPHIVGFNTAEVIDGYVVIDMEYVSGTSLKDMLKDQPRLSLECAVEIAVHILEALIFAQEMHIHHGDVKPANVLISGGGIVKLADFSSGTTLGSHSRVAAAGTYAYMAPEAFLGGLQADYQSDVWSVGVVLYEMIAGRKPFQPENSKTERDWANAISNQTPLPIARFVQDVPPALQYVLSRALAKEKSDRFPSAGAFLASLIETQLFTQTSSIKEHELTPVLNCADKSDDVQARNSPPAQPALSMEGDGAHRAEIGRPNVVYPYAHPGRAARKQATAPLNQTGQANSGGKPSSSHISQVHPIPSPIARLIFRYIVIALLLAIAFVMLPTLYRHGIGLNSTGDAHQNQDRQKRVPGPVANRQSVAQWQSPTRSGSMNGRSTIDHKPLVSPPPPSTDHESVFTGSAYYAPRRLLAACISDGGIMLFNIAIPKRLRTLPTVTPAKGAIFSPRGDYLYAVCQDGTKWHLIRWETKGWKPQTIASADGVSGNIAMSPDGKQVIIVGSMFWWVDTKSKDVSNLPATLNFMSAASVAADGTIVAVGTDNSLTRLTVLPGTGTNRNEQLSQTMPDKVAGNLVLTADGKTAYVAMRDRYTKNVFVHRMVVASPTQGGGTELVNQAASLTGLPYISISGRRLLLAYNCSLRYRDLSDARWQGKILTSPPVTVVFTNGTHNEAVEVTDRQISMQDL